MSIINKLKDKTFVKILTAIVIGVVAVICSLSIMLSSWFSYKAYFDKAYADKEYQKYLNSLPLEFLGIEASVSDVVLYCNNGKASPKEEDFVVMANFTEKGKAFSKKLAANTYTIAYPDNFAARGGDVVITYIYQPEKAADAPKDAPMPEPITKTTTVSVTLADVKVTSIEMMQKPNRVYYQEGASFEADGMELVARYNDGRKSNITGADVDFDSTALTVGAESVTVSYGDATTTVPVTVVSASEYDDGEIVDIAIEGEVFVKENVAVDNTVKANVRGTYETGNKLLLSPTQYSLIGRGTPTFGQSYFVTASLVGAADVTSTYKAYVQKSYEAESATLTGATTTTVESFFYANGNYSSMGNVTAAKVANGNVVTFTITADAAMKTQFNVCLSNQGETVALNKIATMRVNGKKVGVSASAVMNGLNDKSKAVFVDYTLTNLCLNKGENTLSFTFDNIPAGSTVLFDKIGLLMGSKGEVELHTGKYMLMCAKDGTTPVLTKEKAFDWHQAMGRSASLMRGLCTDGTYIYGVGIGYSGDTRVFFVRYDVINGTYETSKDFYFPANQVVVEPTAGITYYDGKLIVYQENGGMKSIPANFDKTTEVSDFTDFNAFKHDGEVITDIYYNQARQLFAVRSSNLKLRIYDKNKTFVTETKVAGVRVTGDDNYIYVSNNKNAPTVEVFDWAGEKVGSFGIPNTKELIGHEAFNNTSTQGIVFMGGDLYYTAIRWSAGSAGDGATIIKMSAADAFSEGVDVVDYTIGETLAGSTITDDDLEVGRYLVDCKVNSQTANVTTTQVLPYGKIVPNYGFGRGICTDGVNMYILCTGFDGGDGAQIVRFNPATGEKSYSKIIKAGNGTDGVQEGTGGITYFKGKLVIFNANGTSNCIDANFTSATEFEPFTGFDAFKKSANEMITDVYYSAEAQKYAVGVSTVGASEWTIKKIRVFNKDMTEIKEFNCPVGNMKVRMSGDGKYFYVSNRGLSPSFYAYDWNGNHVTTFSLPNSAEAMGVEGSATFKTSDMNTQGFVSLNGSFYFMAVCWTAGADTTLMKASRSDLIIPDAPSAVESENNFIPLWEGNLNDACSDGEYLYTSVISQTGVTVYKIDGESMSIEAKSSEIACANATSALYVKDGELCVLVGGKTYAVVLRDFENACVLTEKTTGALSNTLTANASGVTYNADTATYAVVSQSQGKITLVKADGSTIDKTIDVQTAFNKVSGQFLYWGNENQVTITSVTCDEKYVYVSASCKGQTILPVMTFNWDGEMLGATQYVAGVTMPTANGNYDVGGLFVHQGKLLVMARSLGQAGGYVWEIKA